MNGAITYRHLVLNVSQKTNKNFNICLFLRKSSMNQIPFMQQQKMSKKLAPIIIWQRNNASLFSMTYVYLNNSSRNHLQSHI